MSTEVLEGKCECVCANQPVGKAATSMMTNAQDGAEILQTLLKTPLESMCVDLLKV